MKHCRSLALSLFLLATMATPSALAVDRLAPTRAVAGHMEVGTQKLFAGTPPAEAYAPWTAHERQDELMVEIQAQMNEMGGTSIELLGYELELALSHKDGRVLEIRSVVVFPRSGPVGLVELRVREGSSADGVPLDETPRGTETFVAAARALGRELQSKRCSKITIPDPEKQWPDAPFLAEAKESLDELRASLPDLCEKLREPGMTLTHAKLDDFGFFVQDAEGRLVGLLTGDADISRDALVVGVDRIEPMPEPRPEPTPEPTVEPEVEVKEAPAEGPVSVTSNSTDRSTPQATWQTLMDAVAARDLDTYAGCFHEASREREGQVDKLREDPKLWEELDGLLSGPQEMTAEIDGDSARCRVEAPEADGGGIGGLSMERVAGEWLITNW